MKASEIDPSTIHLSVNKDVPLLLRESLESCRITALQHNQYITAFYSYDGDHGLSVTSHTKGMFETGEFQCPRAADFEYELQHNEPRPLPSFVVYPNGEAVVSKPSLCEGCVWAVYKAVNGNCLGKQYTPLLSTNEASDVK